MDVSLVVSSLGFVTVPVCRCVPVCLSVCLFVCFVGRVDF